MVMNLNPTQNKVLGAGALALGMAGAFYYKTTPNAPDQNRPTAPVVPHQSSPLRTGSPAKSPESQSLTPQAQRVEALRQDDEGRLAVARAYNIVLAGIDQAQWQDPQDGVYRGTLGWLGYVTLDCERGILRRSAHMQAPLNALWGALSIQPPLNTDVTIFDEKNPSNQNRAVVFGDQTKALPLSMADENLRASINSICQK